MAEKNGRKKRYIIGQKDGSFLLQQQIDNQSTISQIFNQSDKMDYADVMILELEVRHPGDKEFMEKSF